MIQKQIEEDQDENTVLISTVFNLPEDFMLEVMAEEGYELTREEEQRLMGALESFRIYFEVNTVEGTVYVLGVR